MSRNSIIDLYNTHLLIKYFYLHKNENTNVRVLKVFFITTKGRIEFQSGLLLKIVYSGYIFKVTPNLTADKVP